MDIDFFRSYCLSKNGATESLPFDQDTLVFKVAGKIFALTSLKKWEQGDHSINLKCEPEYANELREQYNAIRPGYHMNKKHWNTIGFNEDVSDHLILKLIDHSYDLVVKGLIRRVRIELEKNTND